MAFQLIDRCMTVGVRALAAGRLLHHGRMQPKVRMIALAGVPVRRILGIVITTALVGCGSEVDKCVAAEVKAWQAEQARVQKEWNFWQERKKIDSPVSSNGKDYSVELGLIVKPDVRSVTEIEAQARKECLMIIGR
jgi:hypothetical protein